MRQNDYFEIIERDLLEASSLGFEKLENGTLLIGKAPHIAPGAWLHTIYSPLDDKEIYILEEQLKLKIPLVFKDFLKKSNGLNVFNTTFYIYGVRKNYNRSVDNNWQPFDIITPNIYERPKHSKDSYFFIGGYDWDGSLIYLNQEDGKVYRCLRDTARPLNEWNSFQEMLISEIKRIIKLHNEKGQEINLDHPTIPPI